MKSIKVSEETWHRLVEKMKGRETFDQVIVRLLLKSGGLSERETPDKGRRGDAEVDQG